MRKYLFLLLAGAVIIAGCGSAKLKADAGNKRVQGYETQGEQIVAQCGERHHHIRQIINCVAPKGHGAAFESCAFSAAARDHGLTKSQRQRLYTDLATCAEKNR